MLVYLLLAAIAVFIFERLFDMLTTKEGLVGYKEYAVSPSILERTNAIELKSLNEEYERVKGSNPTSIYGMFLDAAKTVSNNTRLIAKLKKEIKESEKKK